MIICLDASLVLNWLLPEVDRRQDHPLDVVLGEAEQVMAPPLLFAESTSTLAKFVHADRLAAEEAAALLEGLFRVAISLVHEPTVYLRALEMAARLGHKNAYDTQYIAVAEAAGATLFTADGGMQASANRLGVPTRLLQ